MNKLFNARTLAIAFWLVFFGFVFGDVLNLRDMSTGDYIQEIIFLILALIVSMYVGGTGQIKRRMEDTGKREDS